MKAFDTHPQLMMLNLIRNYRTLDFEKVPFETEEDRKAFRGRLERELRLRCLLMAAWHSARPTIDVCSWFHLSFGVADCGVGDPG